MATAEALTALRERAAKGLKETMDFFTAYAMDPGGGFYGAVTRDLRPVTDAQRSLVLGARLVWSYAAAYRVTGERTYLDTCVSAFAYLKERFIDGAYGGGYWMLDASGKPADSRKYIYGQAFIIYGCSEIARAIGARGGPQGMADEALRLAIDVYELCERHAEDKRHGGYYECYSRAWERLSDSFNIPDPALGSKALNTHLHMIEAYTNLMRVWNDAALRAKVGALIDIMSNKLLDRAIYHYKPYMTDDWGVTRSLVSFGHDIEGAWLLTEASHAYGGEAAVRAGAPLALRIADACYSGGIDPATGGLWYEWRVETGEYNKEMSWWAQAEAVVGFFNAYELSGDEKYLQYMYGVWDYIDSAVIDREDGVFREWLSNAALPAGHPSNRHPVNAWKTPYHNGRMYLEIMERVDGMLGGA